MKVEYSSNNSGGKWWLSDDNWRALEAAGWTVEWFSNPEHRVSLMKDGEDRWLGALAKSATRDGLGLREAADEWARVTDLDPTAAGCACCGQPHNFTEYDDAGNYVTSGPSSDYVCSW